MESGKRNSGIELVKVAAILLIVLSHVVYALVEKNQYMPYSDYIVDLGHVTTDFQTFVLNLFRYAGPLGNSIFFLCSAWFFLERGAECLKTSVLMG